MNWSQLYQEFIGNSITGTLSDSDQLIWLKILCLASQGEPQGVISLKPPAICKEIGISPETWEYALDKFRAKKMIEYSIEGLKICRWGISDQSSGKVEVQVSGSIQISNPES